jgi:hypothetical protein
MTRETFKTKRIKACNDALEKAKQELPTITGRNKNANIKKRIAILEKAQKRYSDNFWDNYTEHYYNCIYVNASENDSVAPY